MASKTYLKDLIGQKDQKIKTLEFQNKQMLEKLQMSLKKSENLQKEIDRLHSIQEPVVLAKKWYEFWKR